MSLCTPRVRSHYCPLLGGGYNTGYPISLMSTGNRVDFDPTPYFAYTAPVVSHGFGTTPFTIPTDGGVDVETPIEAALSWWRPLANGASSQFVNSSGLIGDILPDDTIGRFIYGLSFVQFDLLVTRRRTDYSATGVVASDGHGGFVFNITSSSSTVTSDTQGSTWATTLGTPRGILGDGGSALDEDECFEVNPAIDNTVQINIDSQSSSFTRTSAFHYTLHATVFDNVVKSWTDGFYTYSEWSYTCCPPPECAACAGPIVTIPSGSAAAVCVATEFVDCSSEPTSPSISGGPITGIIVTAESGCHVVVTVPCLTQKQIKDGGFEGPYTITLPAPGNCYDDGHFRCNVYVGSFMVSVGIVCDVTLDTLAVAAIEADGPRRWVHVGKGNQIASYDQQYVPIFAGTFPVDQWLKLRSDPRFGSLAGLARTYAKDAHGNPILSLSATYSIWLSTDGGQTGKKVSEIMATSSMLDRDSERGWLMWFTADTANLVSVRISEDGGQTFAAAVPVHLDTGAQLQAALLDGCQDCRSGGRVALICAVGKDPANPGPTGVFVSDDGGLTFRKVV